MTSGNSIETVIGNPQRSWLFLHIPMVVVAKTYAQAPQGEVASLLPFKSPSIPRTGLVDCCSPCHCQVSPPPSHSLLWPHLATIILRFVNGQESLSAEDDVRSTYFFLSRKHILCTYLARYFDVFLHSSRYTFCLLLHIFRYHWVYFFISCNLFAPFVFILGPLTAFFLAIWGILGHSQLKNVFFLFGGGANPLLFWSFRPFPITN